MSLKKSQQLGMNVSTAQGKLLKDILWMLLQETNRTKCFVCGEEMSRETFSIEHKIPWLDSTNPKELFFNLSNISFSHMVCNVKRLTKPIKHGTLHGYNAKGCRCELCTEAIRKYKASKYTTEDRRKRYEKYGS